jgi:hypothetical protein
VSNEYIIVPTDEHFIVTDSLSEPVNVYPTEEASILLYFPRASISPANSEERH